jgi:RNA polymerase sigma-70 factor (ECF subfamily)
VTSPATHPRDVDYLALYQGGDAQAFQALVDAYRDRIVQFFYRLCWDRDRAEDLAQDLFLKLLLGSKRYRPEGKLVTFVYRVATNLWIDHYRQARPRPRFHSYDQAMYPADVSPGREFDSGVATPAQLAADDEEKRALRQALERLTEPHRLVFELAVYQQLPYAEIAELLGIPVGTVKSRMHNSVAALKDVLASHSDTARRAGGDA